MSRPGLAARVAAAPRRSLSGRFWHQGAAGRDLTSFADPAVTEGRFHRVGDEGVWYCSDREQAAWAELFRHFTADGVDPFEVRRRVGSVRVDGLGVLDLTKATVREAVGITEADLIGDDYSVSQLIAAQAREAGFDGVLAPSAALPGNRTLVLFPSAMRDVTVESSRVRQPPPRLADLVAAVRSHPDASTAARVAMLATAAAGSAAVRRLRRST